MLSTTLELSTFTNKLSEFQQPVQTAVILPLPHSPEKDGIICEKNKIKVNIKVVKILCNIAFPLLYYMFFGLLIQNDRQNCRQRERFESRLYALDIIHYHYARAISSTSPRPSSKYKTRLWSCIQCY